MKKGLSYLLLTMKACFVIIKKLILIGIILVFAFVISMLWWSLAGDQSKMQYSQPKHCSQIHLSEILTCSGFTTGGWQNSQTAEMSATGQVNKLMCERFKRADFSNSTMAKVDNIDGFEGVFKETSLHGYYCDENEPEKFWVKVICPWSSDNYSCYHCTRFLRNGNGYRYNIVGFSDDCETGRYTYIADPSHRSFLERVKLIVRF